jgi:hypothetical protein
MPYIYPNYVVFSPRAVRTGFPARFIAAIERHGWKLHTYLPLAPTEENDVLIARHFVANLRGSASAQEIINAMARWHDGGDGDMALAMFVAPAPSEGTPEEAAIERLHEAFMYHTFSRISMLMWAIYFGKDAPAQSLPTLLSRRSAVVNIWMPYVHL